MPYPEFRKVGTEDIYAIIAYIKTLEPISNEVPVSEIKLPFNIYHRVTNRPADPQEIPPASDTVAYGAYLTNMAGCQYCHTPTKWLLPVAGMEFAGGHEYCPLRHG